MVQVSDIRGHMEVVGSDDGHVGTVDHIEETGRIKLARADSGDGSHHYLPLSAVARVDDKVRLSLTAAAALALAGDNAAASVAGFPVQPDAADTIVPPIHNRAVPGAPARRNFYLPWIVGVIGLLLLALLLIRACVPAREKSVMVDPANGPAPGATAPLPVEPFKLPNGASVNLPANTLNYAVQRYLASDEPAPRSFTFDKLNFDPASAAIRPEDAANVDALARILQAYPKARVRIVGYTDAKGTAPANDRLGERRAQAVVAALAAKGVDRTRLEAASGGEANPADTNATAQGRFDNRRSELVVTAK